MSRLVSIANFVNAAEAEYAANYLQSEGVPAAVDGATAGTALSYIGTAVAGIRLLVDEAQVERSEQLLRELNEPNGDGSPWFCGKCEEEVDSSFAACWSCGGDRNVVGSDVRPSKAEPTGPEPPNVKTSDNPYEPIVEGLSDKGRPETDPQVQDLLDRAWNAIILGSVFLPFIMQPYGLYLLYQATRVTTDFSPEMKRQFKKVLIAGIVSCCFWGLLILSFFV